MYRNLKPSHKNRGIRSISELVGGVLAPILARRAGMTLDLLRAWPDLVGSPFGTTTRPEKIVWPRRVSDDDPFEPATLVIACDSSQAVFVQHETGEILEKVNVFFGFNAISRLKIMQKPVELATGGPIPKVSPKLSADDEAYLAEIVNEVEDEDLRRSLRRIGEGILLKRKRQVM